jgi:hypothetical protein
MSEVQKHCFPDAFVPSQEGQPHFHIAVQLQCCLRGFQGSLKLTPHQRLAGNDVECPELVLSQSVLFEEHPIVVPAREKFCVS